MDRISKLPPGIIETILCLLPIQEAARTSILSREWRYHWIKIPKLTFVEDAFEIPIDGAELSVLERTFSRPSERKQMTKRCKLFNAINQVLLMHEGPIHEFALSMEVDDSCVEIDHIILHLSKRYTVKTLKLDLAGQYVLPVSFCSLHHLTNMALKNCSLRRLQSFSGFDGLTTLCLQYTVMRVKTLLCLLSSCPLLKRFTFDSCYVITSDDEDFTIFDLFKCLPVIEYLHVQSLFVRHFKFLVPERLLKELPTTLIHLKCLCLHKVCVRQKYELPFLALLIKSSPNLEKLKLQMFDYNSEGIYLSEYNLEDDEFSSLTLEDCLDFTLEHLNEVELLNFSDTEGELDFVKLILAKSPVLKKVRIILSNKLDKDEEVQILKFLLSFPCAAPMVKILVR